MRSFTRRNDRRDQRPSPVRSRARSAPGRKTRYRASAPRKQANSQRVQGEYYLRCAAPELALAAFRRQVELRSHAGAARREYRAIGNVGSAQTGCRRRGYGDRNAAHRGLAVCVPFVAAYGLQLHLGTLAAALAWHGDDVDILPLAREAFDHLRLLGVTFAPLMAAALEHARRNDPQRAALLCGYAYSKCWPDQHPSLAALPIRQRVREASRGRTFCVHRSTLGCSRANA